MHRSYGEDVTNRKGEIEFIFLLELLLIGDAKEGDNGGLENIYRMVYMVMWTAGWERKLVNSSFNDLTSLVRPHIVGLYYSN